MMKLRKICLNSIFSVLCVFYAATGLAEEFIQAEISLVALHAETTAESGGDEIYLDIVTYFSDKNSRQQRVPDFPLAWNSETVDEVRNLIIWEYPLANQQAATVIISVMEQDIPPWNTNDLVGFVKVNLKNNDGVLQSSFSASQHVSAPQGENHANSFQLTGNNSNYELVLLVTP